MTSEQVRHAAKSLMNWIEREASEVDQQLVWQLTEWNDEPFYWMSLPGLPAPWIAQARYVLRDGQPVIRDLMIYPDMVNTDEDIPPRGLTSTTLRDLQTGPEAQYRRAVAELLFRRSGYPTSAPARRRRVPQGPRYSDAEVAQFAVDYWQASMRSPNPRRALLDDYAHRGRHETDHSIAEWIRRAADRGFLTKARGSGDRAPRQPTEKLREWQHAAAPKRKREKR